MTYKRKAFEKTSPSKKISWKTQKTYFVIVKIKTLQTSNNDDLKMERNNFYNYFAILIFLRFLKKKEN